MIIKIRCFNEFISVNYGLDYDEKNYIKKLNIGVKIVEIF